MTLRDQIAPSENDNEGTHLDHSHFNTLGSPNNQQPYISPDVIND